uniref:Uncharacterized protein n=1 Tax=Arundo donax TaxID=35708 RepID=A0A0A9CJJ5_ARUDO
MREVEPISIIDAQAPIQFVRRLGSLNKQ